MTLLLTLFLKSLLVFALCGLLLLFLRRSSAAARHLVCLLTLGAVLLLPLCAATLPGWHLPMLGAEPTPVRPSPALPVREGKELSRVPGLKPPGTPQPPAFPSSSSLTGRTPAKQGGGFLTQGSGLQTGFLALYLLGVLLAAARPLLGLWGIRQIDRAGTASDDAPTLALADGCARLLGVSPPRVCRAPVPVPMTWGWRRPVVALPLASTDWPEDRLRSVLLHETAHLKRRDWPGHRFADFACALLWLHPCAWLTARRLRAESEMACDDLVLASGVPAPDYARHLLEIASALPRTAHSSHAIAMAQTSKIESRLTMILDKTRSRRPIARRVLVFAFVPTAAALVTLAVLKPEAKARTLSQAALSPGTTAIQIAGIMDATLPGDPGWDKEGSRLTTAPFDWDSRAQGVTIINKPGQRSLFIVFQTPPGRQQLDPTVEIDGTVLGFTMISPKSEVGSSMVTFRLNSNPQMLVHGVAFPTSLSHTNVRVGVPSGSWTRESTVRVSSTSSSRGRASNDSEVHFSLPHGETRDTYDFRAVAVGADGSRMILSGLNAKTLGSREIVSLTVPASAPHLSFIRFESRPCTWQVFKDVALQPVK